jgi:hypothetical protein
MQQTRVLQAERPHDTFYDPVYISSNDLPQGFYSKYQKTLVLRKGEKPSSSSLMGGNYYYYFFVFFKLKFLPMPYF